MEGLDFNDFYNKHLYCLDILGHIFAQDFFFGGNLYRCICPQKIKIFKNSHGYLGKILRF